MFDLNKDLSSVNKNQQQPQTQTYELIVTVKKLESVCLTVEANSHQHALQLIKEGCIARTQVGFELDDAVMEQGSNEEYELIHVRDNATNAVLC